MTNIDYLTGAHVLGAREGALSLLSSEAVRTRARAMLALGSKDELLHFRVDLERLENAADLVIETTRAAYPSLEVPLHSRWRHFEFHGVDRWAAAVATRPVAAAKFARAAFDLAIISVLLDAGAGTCWAYHDRTSGASIGHSEGLALAALSMFQNGVFSADPNDPLRADAAVLCNLPAEVIRRGLQVNRRNPLVGLEGRINLLHRLGQVAAEHPEIFGREDAPRPGGLFDLLVASASEKRIRAPALLTELLVRLSPIWGSRLTLGGVPLGDCWHHPLLRTDDATDGLIPLHKLSQWLTYSLIEPLQWAGYTIDDIDGLTGLAEYRNGGLFVDAGILTLRDPTQARLAHDVGSPLVVEWRALTVALLDELARTVQRRLNLSAQELPLAKLLQGGTWAAGRVLAGHRRSDGAPPIRIISDGTVF